MNDTAVQAVTRDARPAAGQRLLHLEGVTKVFLTDEVETHALSNVHMTVHQGEWVAIVGPSGSGKTTLLAILGLLDTPTSGSYLLGDRPVAGLSASQRAWVRNRQIGFIFQSFNLIGDLTVFENVELPLTYRGMPTAERKRRVESAGSTSPVSSPVVSSSAWRWPGQWPVTRCSCSPTSPPETSTRRTARR
jgi:putative ABC transport system ATP-binding protein